MAKLANLKTAEIEKISHLDYFNIAVSVDCVIFGYENKELKVLLIKSDLEEFTGLWSLLGDLVRTDEDIESAPYRVLKERTGMDDVYLDQVHTFGNIGRHPSGRVITIAYYSLIDIKHHKLKLTHNELHWHKVNEIKKLAFDHKKILDRSLERLREQVMEHPIIFNLLPEKFSLRELQDLYQAILGVGLDRRNFRKKIAHKDWLIDLDEMEEDVPHRPGKLYKAKSQTQKKQTKKKTSQPEARSLA
ncbi:MAG TPA: NUDIX domain-containing protein [Chitinophagaceae bacterium]|jgi:8-oxo-dGTP diphosphatase|nr:NUDIX domain-containing protein [Chitinophagaceae bacterium]